jgi:hypothetical protein
MLEILFLLLRNQIHINISTKILHLLVKCMTRVCKYNNLMASEEADLTFIVHETNSILK